MIKEEIIIKQSWHVQDYCKSRHYELEFALWKAMCEFCPIRIIETNDHTRYPVMQVHHNEKSLRAKRKHRKDWHNLIWVCCHCHEHIHNSWTYDRQQMIQVIIAWAIDYTDLFYLRWFDSQMMMREEKENYRKILLQLYDYE